MASPVSISKLPSGEFRLQARQQFARPLGEVFTFFADAGNLERLTPAHLQFQILTPQPIEMRPGVLIDYRLRLRGIPIRWRTEIAVWQPPYRFVDRQLTGPYRKWIHEHRFQEVAGTTVADDIVDYEIPLSWLSSSLVAYDLRKIFAFRHEVLEEIFGAVNNQNVA